MNVRLSSTCFVVVLAGVAFGGSLTVSALATESAFACGKVVPEMAQLAPGAVKPSGWLRDVACAVRDGYSAHMDEVDVQFSRAWTADTTPRGKDVHWWSNPGSWSCEGGAYWFDGLVRLAFQLDDSALKAMISNRLETVLTKTSGKTYGFCWWMSPDNPQDVADMKGDGFLAHNAEKLESTIAAWYEATGDARAERALRNAFTPQMFAISKPVQGAFDAYRLTRDPALAARLDACCAELAADRKKSRGYYARPPHPALGETLNLKYRHESALGIPSRHGIFAHCSLARQLCAYRWTGDASWLETVRAWYAFFEKNCRQPYGHVVMDEEWGHAGPTRATETCTAVIENATKLELMATLGEGSWGDDVETSVFNLGPNCFSPDFRAHVYMQQPNRLKANDLADCSHGGDPDPQGRPHTHGRYERKQYPLCCTAGLNRIFPDYIQAMWMRTRDGGVAASLYGPCTFETTLAGGRFAVREETSYPFGETVRFVVDAAPEGPVPLRLRLPKWCANPAADVNGAAVDLSGAKGFATVARTWKRGDVMTLRLPVKPVFHTMRDANHQGRAYGWLTLGSIVLARHLPSVDANTPLDPNAAPPEVDRASAEAAEAVWTPSPVRWDRPDAPPVKVTLKDASGAPLELIPYGLAKFRVTMFPLATAANGTGETVRSAGPLANNGQLLRVPRSFAKAEKRAIFWKALEANPGAFSELALFTRWSDEARPVDFHREAIGDVRDFMADAHARGYVAGVNVLPTAAFPEDYAVQHVAGARNRVTEKGVEQRGTLCLRSPVTLKLVHDLCALYASAGVDFVYLDDDVDLAHCYCPDCLRRFAELSGFAVTGAADVCAARNAADPDVRRRARNAWIDLADESRAAFFAAAAKGAHSVSTKVGVGCMTCAAAISDRAGKLWSEALAGEAKTPVRWRPGGGCWSDQSKGEMLAKLENIVQQIRGVPASAEVQAELECFPYHGLQKSPGFIGYEAMLYVAWGCDAVAFNIFGGDPEALADEFRGSLERAAAVAPTLRDLRRTFDERPAEGVAYPWGRFALTDVTRDWSDWGLAPRPTAFACIGLPVASDPAAAQVLLVDESAARGLSPSALTNALSGGVYLDAAALTALTERGFGDLVGFAISNDAPRTAGFRDLDHPLNLPGCRKRRIRYSLSGGRESRVPLLVRRSDKAEFTSESVLSAFADERCGYNGGVFENALGGRIAVCTQLPFVECESLPRAEHLKRTLRWLSKDSLPGYVKSFHRTLLRVRNGAFFAANVSSEAQRDVELALRTDGPLACTLWEGGVSCGRAVLEPVRTDGAYSTYRLPLLPNLGTALLTHEGKRP